MKIITIDEIKQRINNKFPNQPYEIIEYTKVSKPFTIKCLTCGERRTYSSFDNFIRNGQAICECLGRTACKAIQKQNKEKILQLINNNHNQTFIDWGYREHTQKETVKVLCEKCNQIFEKSKQDYLKTQTCPFCESHHDMNDVVFRSLIPQDYEPLEEYQGTDTKILMRHKCGFIRKISPHTLLSGRAGCPRCSDKMSHGEKKIVDYLDSQKILFQKEATFKWQSNPRYRYDFYIPEYNLIIEYHGEQHYKEFVKFESKLPLAERQERDSLKEREAKQQGYNYLIISYTNFRKIEQILENWFNDYPNVEQDGSDCRPKEETSIIDENIV